MYNSTYEDYIRNMIGKNNDIYENEYNNFGNNIYENFDGYTYNQNSRNYSSDNLNLQDCYPEIYKLIYPMVQKVCMKNTETISRELIDKMTEEVYMNFAGDNEAIELNINLNNDVRSGKQDANKISKTTRAFSNTAQNNKIDLSKNTETSKKENLNRYEEENKESRQFRPRNPLLNDLIRILILRELLGRPGEINRPPFGRPLQGRPPFNNPNFPNRPPFFGSPRDTSILW